MIKYPFVTTNLMTRETAEQVKEVLAKIEGFSKLKITGSAVRGQWSPTDLQILGGPALDEVLRYEFGRGVRFSKCKLMFSTKDANIFIDLWYGNDRWLSSTTRTEIRP